MNHPYYMAPTAHDYQYPHTKMLHIQQCSNLPHTKVAKNVHYPLYVFLLSFYTANRGAFCLKSNLELHHLPNTLLACPESLQNHPDLRYSGFALQGTSPPCPAERSARSGGNRCLYSPPHGLHSAQRRWSAPLRRQFPQRLVRPDVPC